MSKNDEKIKALMVKVADMKKGLGEKPRFVLRTNGLVNDGSKSYNINVLSKEQVLDIFGYLIQEFSKKSEAAKILGLTAFDKKINGFMLNDWQDDFKNRIAVIEYQEKKARLDATEAQLKALSVFT